MRQLTMALTKTKPLFRPEMLDDAWRPSASVSRSLDDITDLPRARAALSDAEQLILAQEARIRQLENMALTDELTGLTNRRGFILAFQRELALAQRDIGASGILVMTDLDGFKSINDSWGHSVGDHYLKSVAETLSGCVRTSDVVARLGGDEFAILFTRMDEKTGIRRVEKLERTFNSKDVLYKERRLPLRASFGFIPYTATDLPEALIASADLKLYAHKARRRAAVNAS